MEQITPEMISVMAVVAAAVFLFVVEWVRVDVVALMVMAILPLLGVVSAQEAFMGLSSNAVVSIIAVIIIGAGLDRTGIMNNVVAPITKLAGNSESRLMALVAATVAFISSFMQNIGAVALFLPAVKRVSSKVNVPPSRILMPMGFLGIIGGCLTLVGSSPLILLNDLLKPRNLEPFGLFDVTPVGIALVVAALAYFMLLGGVVLPKAAPSEEDTVPDVSHTMPSMHSHVYELLIPNDYSGSHTLQELDIRPTYLLTIVAIAKDGGKRKIMAPTRDEKLEALDHIAVLGAQENVERFAADFKFTLKPRLKVFEDDLAQDKVGMVEVVISPRSDLVGRSMRSFQFRKTYQVSPLAVKRQEDVYYKDLADIELIPGDFLVMHGSWERFAILRDNKSFTFITDFQAEVMKTHKALVAGLCFAVALGMVITSFVPLSVALLTGAIGMILTGVLTVDEAYKAVDWRTIFLLAGLIPLGVAAENTGTASFIANNILAALGSPTPLVLITTIAVLTSIFTLVISNVGATVLLVPLAVNMAMSAGADPRMAALTVAVAASNTFILPTHQVNAFIMGPGGYRTKDYLRAGGLMTIIYLVVMVASIMALSKMGM